MTAPPVRAGRFYKEMKKVFQFLRSMRFGILLLCLIAVCSVIGSLLPQGEPVAVYAQAYPRFHGWILMLGLNRIFQSWYFIALLVLLCLNLLLCSLLRIRSVVKSRGGEEERMARRPNERSLTPAELERVREYLKSRRCRERTVDGVTVWQKNGFGRYGTFITHLSILLVLVFGALALYLPTVVDRSCMPGESLVMEDGTEIAVDSFAIEDAEGKLDYRSDIRVKLPDGRESETATIRVNHPLSFGNYKIYQQTYGTAGSITVRNTSSGGEDTFYLTGVGFLSLDGVNGLWFDALYPGYIVNEDGGYTLITSTSGHYPDPVYHVTLSTDGEYTPVLAFPGETLTVGELDYVFNAPVEYPGLRIKYTPGAVNVLLLLAFLLMIAGLYITFFTVPVLVKTDGEGCAVGGPKPEGTRVELELLLSKQK